MQLQLRVWVLTVAQGVCTQGVGIRVCVLTIMLCSVFTSDHRYMQLQLRLCVLRVWVSGSGFSP